MGSSGGRIAVIGDVGGHLGPLTAELARLGVPEEGRGPLPDDLTVIQVGDLVHRGPDSAGVVRLVDAHLMRTPERWIQLIGNHEAQYVRPPAFQWPERLDGDSARLLQDWWHEGRMVAAASFAAGGEQMLVTHAGLTHGYWRDLGSPPSARAAAEALNDLARRGEESLFRGGQLLGGGGPSLRAGPLWAQAATELVASWTGVAMPFSQVHGHSSAAADVAGDGAVEMDAETGHEVVVLDGGRIVGVDPDHGAEPRASWQALVVSA